MRSGGVFDNPPIPDTSNKLVIYDRFSAMNLVILPVYLTAFSDVSSGDLLRLVAYSGG